MGKEVAPTDVYMQFAALTGVWPGVTTVLSEVALKTALTVRGGLMWLVHQIEFFTFPTGLGANWVQLSLSVRDKLIVIPNIDDPGCIASMTEYSIFTSSGRAQSIMPKVSRFLPPIPLAAPNLSLYWVSKVDATSLDNSAVRARIGYTTAPLDARSYAEIAETWAYV